MKTTTIKTILNITLAVAIVFEIAEIITGIRMGTPINFSSMTMVFSALTIGYCALSDKEKAAAEKV